jgi:hypothetical protein
MVADIKAVCVPRTHSSALATYPDSITGNSTFLLNNQHVLFFSQPYPGTEIITAITATTYVTVSKAMDLGHRLVELGHLIPLNITIPEYECFFFVIHRERRERRMRKRKRGGIVGRG